MVRRPIAIYSIIMLLIDFWYFTLISSFFHRNIIERYLYMLIG